MTEGYDHAGQDVLITGLGVTGQALARALVAHGARVSAFDEAPSPAALTLIKDLGAAVISDAALIAPAQFHLVVTSPGWPPSHPVLTRLRTAGVEIIGDVELAWRLDQERSRREGTTAPRWLALTGTNGKTTSVGMLASILSEAGVRSVAAGNVGLPLVDAVLAQPRLEAVAIELSSFQLHWSSTVRPHAGALINIAEDHLDWHGSLDAYAAAKISLLASADLAILNVDDVLATHYAAGVHAPIAVTRDIPRPGEVGMVEDLMVDRAFTDPDRAEELATIADITPSAAHNISNALIAAALARSIGVPADAVARGLRAYRSDGHRIEQVATIEGICFIDDSKATNPHAATASISAFDSVVWIAGGLAKGAAMEELVETIGDRLRGVVLIGSDREIIADALTRHAPEVPVLRVDPPDTGGVVERDSALFMGEVVRAARSLAGTGDTVLLAPACASMDQFTSYAQRGRLFAEAVRSLS